MIIINLNIKDKKELYDDYNRISIISEDYYELVKSWGNSLYESKLGFVINKEKSIYYILYNNFKSEESITKSFLNLRNYLLATERKYELKSNKFYIEDRDINDKIKFNIIRDIIGRIFDNTNIEFILYTIDKK